MGIRQRFTKEAGSYSGEKGAVDRGPEGVIEEGFLHVPVGKGDETPGQPAQGARDTGGLAKKAARDFVGVGRVARGADWGEDERDDDRAA